MCGRSERQGMSPQDSEQARRKFPREKRRQARCRNRRWSSPRQGRAGTGPGALKLNAWSERGAQADTQALSLLIRLISWRQDIVSGFLGRG